jgi:putative phosphoesterase
MPQLGIISDTHNFLDPQVKRLFAGVDHILHAGDIGLPWIIMELEEIAPVTAVLGNIDTGLSFRETEVIELFGRTFLLHHVVEPHHPTDALRRRLSQVRPDIVVFGHTHRPFCEQIGPTLFLNPGSAGKRRFHTPRSVAVLRLGPSDAEVDFHDLHDTPTLSS